MIASYSLPMPPSLNSAYANFVGRGRIPTKKLKAWKIEAGWELQKQKPRAFDVPVEIDIKVQLMPKQRGSDIDGRLKFVVDLLVSHGVIKDDSSKYVRRVSGEWITPGLGHAACKVTVSSAGE